MINTQIKALLCIIIYLSISSFIVANYHDKQGAVVSASVIQEDQSLQQEKEGFIIAFATAYNHLTVKDLNIPQKDITTFLVRAFQDEIDDHGNPGVYLFKLVNEKGSLVGYFSIEDYDELKKITKNECLHTFPSHSVYIRQLYVDVTYQRRGIANLILNQVIPDYFKGVKHIYVAPRKINKPAVSLYTENGFIPTSKSLHNLPEDRYISFVKQIKP